MVVGCEWCCNSYGIISYPIRINLSRDPIVSEVASAVKTCYSHSWILGQVVYVSDRIILGAEHLAKKKASSHKLQAASLTRLKDSVG